MPWDLIPLNSGYNIPSVAYGTGSLGSGPWPVAQITQAFDTGFYHIDTAQLYRNEADVAIAINEIGVERSNLFITTKFSGLDGLDIPTYTAGALVIKPAANQIYLHPYNYQQQSPTLEYAAKHDIVIEAYGALTPITGEPGGPVDAPVDEIATRLKVTADQVLLAWVKAKGTVAVTTSSKKTRLLSYLSAGDLELSADDIKAIDTAGAIGEKRITVKNGLRKLGVCVLVGITILGACSYFRGRRKRRIII